MFKYQNREDLLMIVDYCKTKPSISTVSRSHNEEENAMTVQLSVKKTPLMKSIKKNTRGESKRWEPKQFQTTRRRSAKKNPSKHATQVSKHWQIM